MARHRIGPEQRWGERPARSIGASLDEVLALVGWAELDELLAGISSSSKGESGWPPLALFRALVAAVMRQRDARGVVVRTGTLVDTALIPSASTKDEQARWAGHRRRKPVHGYKAHVATDQDAGLIGGVEITTANKHDASELAAILPDAPGDTDGDSAHQGNRPKGIIGARGGRPRIVHTGGFGGAAAEERQRKSGCGCTMPKSVGCVAGLRRCSARPNGPTGCARCAGWDLRRPACRSGSLRLPTIYAAL